MKTLAEIFPGRLHVHDQRDVAPVLHPVVRCDLHACVTRHRHQMRLRVRRASNGCNGRNGIEKSLAGENLRRPQIFVGHLDDAPARRVSNLSSFAIWRRDRRSIPAATFRASRLRRSSWKPCPWCCSDRPKVPTPRQPRETRAHRSRRRRACAVSARSPCQNPRAHRHANHPASGRPRARSLVCPPLKPPSVRLALSCHSR